MFAATAPVKIAGLLVGPLLFLLLLILPGPEAMPVAAWRTAAVAAWMATWWITEAIPIAVTALLPLVVFPLLAIETMEGAAAPYANPIIFLFMGGFMISWSAPSMRTAMPVCAMSRPRMALVAAMMSPSWMRGATSAILSSGT